MNMSRSNLGGSFSEMFPENYAREYQQSVYICALFKPLCMCYNQLYAI